MYIIDSIRFRFCSGPLLCGSHLCTATAFADLNEAGVCNAGQVNDLIHFLSLLTNGESSASARTLENTVLSRLNCQLEEMTLCVQLIFTSENGV